jgi:hypothetical protein
MAFDGGTSKRCGEKHGTRFYEEEGKHVMLIEMPWDRQRREMTWGSVCIFFHIASGIIRTVII